MLCDHNTWTSMNFYSKWELDPLKLKCVSHDIISMIKFLTRKKEIKLSRSFCWILRKLPYLRKKLLKKKALWIQTWKLQSVLFRKLKEVARVLSEPSRLLIIRKEKAKSKQRKDKVKRMKASILMIHRLNRKNKWPWFKKLSKDFYQEEGLINWEKLNLSSWESLKNHKIQMTQIHQLIKCWSIGTRWEIFKGKMKNNTQKQQPA